MGVLLTLIILAVVYIGVGQRVRIKKYYMSVFEEEKTSKTPGLTKSEINLVEKAAA